MLTKDRQIRRLLAHLKARPADKQARARLFELGYVPPKPTISVAAFDAVLKQYYTPHDVTNRAYQGGRLPPMTVCLPSGGGEANARKLGYGVAYVVVKREYADHPLIKALRRE